MANPATPTLSTAFGSLDSTQLDATCTTHSPPEKMQARLSKASATIMKWVISTCETDVALPNIVHDAISDHERDEAEGAARCSAQSGSVVIAMLCTRA